MAACMQTYGPHSFFPVLFRSGGNNSLVMLMNREIKKDGLRGNFVEAKIVCLLESAPNVCVERLSRLHAFTPVAFSRPLSPTVSLPC